MFRSLSLRSVVLVTRGRVGLLGAVTLLVVLAACPDFQSPLPGSPCTSDDDCADGLFCNGAESCDGGSCVAGTAPCGDPLPPCTDCDEQGGVCIVPACTEDADCDDGLFCTGIETCSDDCGCVSGDPLCGDPLPQCTDCDEEGDECIEPSVCTEDAQCDDGLFCNGAEGCDGCACVPGTPPCGDPLAPCTECDEEGDVCIEPLCNEDAECDDGLFCTGIETCSDDCGCVAGDPPCADPLAPCTECDEEGDVCIEPLCNEDAECDDGLFCTGIETCSDACVCVEGEPPCECGCSEDTKLCLDCCTSDAACDDGLACTDDSCDLTSGECVNADNCVDDGLFCNGTLYCASSGECVNSDTCAYTGPCDENNDVCINPFESEECLTPSEFCGLDSEVDFGPALALAIDDCDTLELVAAYVAECDDSGLVVIVVGTGLVITAKFYEEESGGFVARRDWSDGIDELCAGKTYCPIVADCDDAVVSESLCGDFRNVGDVVHLLDRP